MNPYRKNFALPVLFAPERMISVGEGLWWDEEESCFYVDTLDGRKQVVETVDDRDGT